MESCVCDDCQKCSCFVESCPKALDVGHCECDPRLLIREDKLQPIYEDISEEGSLLGALESDEFCNAFRKRFAKNREGGAYTMLQSEFAEFIKWCEEIGFDRTVKSLEEKGFVKSSIEFDEDGNPQTIIRKIKDNED